MKIKAIFLLLAVSIAVQGLQVENHQQKQQEIDSTQELATEMNRGYNIFQGNPLNEDGEDKGYKEPIFKSDFYYHRVTPDKKFVISDTFLYSSWPQCSYLPQTSQIRGTKSYQQALSEMVNVWIDTESIFFSAFSLSSDFKKVESDTLTQKNVDVQTTSYCKFYSLSRFGNLQRQLSSNFVNDMRSRDWYKVVKTYGTHFMYNALYGGRYIRRTTFTPESIAKMTSQSISIDYASQIDEANSSASFATNKLTPNAESSIFRESAEQITEFFKGGIQTQNITEWKQSIKENPAPIKFQLYKITYLFQFIPGINLAEAYKGFDQAIDYYYGKKVKMPQQVTDLYQPLQTKETQEFGGNGGDEYRYLSGNKIKVNLKKISMRCGTLASNLKFQFFDGNDWNSSPIIGLSAEGQSKVFEVEEGDRITEVEVWTGTRLEGIQFKTAKGVLSGVCGRRKDIYHMFKVDPGWRIIGLRGRRGTHIDKIGLILGKTTVLKALEPIINFSGKYGGTSGKPFKDQALDVVNFQIRKIMVRSIGFGLTVQYGNPKTQQIARTPCFGGGYGFDYTYEVPKGQYLSQVNIRWDDRIRTIQFISNGGYRVKFGNDEGRFMKSFIAAGQTRFVGVYGTAGQGLISLGFITATRP